MGAGGVNFGGGTYDDIRFNGRSFEENALRFDGIEAGGIISNNPSNIGGEMGSVFRLQASLENVQEFRVDASNYPAEFGTGSGGPNRSKKWFAVRACPSLYLYRTRRITQNSSHFSFALPNT